MEEGEYGLRELFAELVLESPPNTTKEEDVEDGGPYELAEEEAEELFAILSQVLKEEEEKKEAEEFSKWLEEWKVLTDEAEEMLRTLGFKDEIIHVECFEEIMSGGEIDSDEEIGVM